jgi:Glycosyl hydrolases family 25
VTSDTDTIREDAMTATGIDLYHGNPMPPLTNLDFVILKASQGAAYTDPDYATRAATVRTAGKSLGAYLFATTHDAVNLQVGLFAATIAGWKPDFVALDFENDGTWSLYNPTQLRQLCQSLLTGLRALNIPVVLYCNLSTWDDICYALDPALYDAVWLASPDGSNPIGAALIQTTAATINGVVGPFDYDTGSLDFLGDDMATTLIPLFVDAVNHRAYATFEVGSNSQWVTAAYVAVKALWGDLDEVSIVMCDDNGRPLPLTVAHESPNEGILVNTRLWVQCPSGASDVTITWSPQSTGLCDGYVILRG